MRDILECWRKMALLLAMAAAMIATGWFYIQNKREIMSREYFSEPNDATPVQLD